jgi:hypothetical protein
MPYMNVHKAAEMSTLDSEYGLAIMGTSLCGRLSLFWRICACNLGRDINERWMVNVRGQAGHWPNLNYASPERWA